MQPSSCDPATAAAASAASLGISAALGGDPTQPPCFPRIPPSPADTGDLDSPVKGAKRPRTHSPPLFNESHSAKHQHHHTPSYPHHHQHPFLAARAAAAAAACFFPDVHHQPSTTTSTTCYEGYSQQVPPAYASGYGQNPFSVQANSNAGYNVASLANASVPK